MFKKKSSAFTTYCRGYENVLSNLVEFAPAYDPELGFGAGDFAVSNKERTVFTFRYPSQEEISFSNQG